MKRLLLVLLCASTFVSFTTPAFAEAPSAPAPKAKAKAVPKRRAAKHDQARSLAVKGARVHVMTDIWIVGRPQRPLSVLDTAAQPFRFPVGTARYSPGDRRFLPADTQERW